MVGPDSLDPPAMRPTPRCRPHGAVVALSLLSLACADSSTSIATASSVRDSAGVRIVEFEGDAQSESMAPLELIHRFGDQPGEYAFQRAGYGALFDDGRAAIGDVGNAEVVVIAADGSGSTTWARGGEGPGEVGWVYGLEATNGDSLWIQDRGNGRFMRFVGGVLDEEWSTQDRPTLSRGLRTLGADDDGRLLMITASFNPRFDEPWFQASLVRFDVAAGVADTVGAFDMTPRTPEQDVDPFGAFGFAAVSGGEWVVARSDRAELTWRSSDGAVRQIVRWTPPTTHPTEADWQSFQNAMRADLRAMNPGLSEEMAEQISAEQAARYSPRFDDPLPVLAPPVGDDEGRVWLGDFVPDRSPPTRYRIFERDGTLQATVEFPTPVEILEVRSGRVLGLVTDEFDVQSVVVYRVGGAETG